MRNYTHYNAYALRNLCRNLRMTSVADSCQNENLEPSCFSQDPTREFLNVQTTLF
jgi:hypothetical protein